MSNNVTKRSNKRYDRRVPSYTFKIRRYSIMDRLAWWFIKRQLNTSCYKMTKRYDGPRDWSAGGTKKENQTGWRIYLKRRPNVETW